MKQVVVKEIDNAEIDALRAFENNRTADIKGLKRHYTKEGVCELFSINEEMLKNWIVMGAFKTIVLFDARVVEEFAAAMVEVLDVKNRRTE